MSFGTEVDCTMTYRRIGSSQVYPAACLRLDGTDILFRADRPIDTGKALEIQLSLDQTGTPPMAALVEVTHSHAAGGRTFEIAASIRGVKGR